MTNIKDVENVAELENNLRILIFRADIRNAKKRIAYRELKQQFRKYGIELTKEYIENVAMSENTYYKLTRELQKINAKIQQINPYLHVADLDNEEIDTDDNNYKINNRIVYAYARTRRKEIRAEITKLKKTLDKSVFMYQNVKNRIKQITKMDRMPFLSWIPLSRKQQLRKDWKQHKNEYPDFRDYAEHKKLMHDFFMHTLDITKITQHNTMLLQYKELSDMTENEIMEEIYTKRYMEEIQSLSIIAKALQYCTSQT